MTKTLTTSQRRYDQAERALDKLGRHRSDHQVMLVECRQGHTVAAVYATDLGPVLLSRIGPHAHGDMDFQDVGHKYERPGRDFIDMLQAPWADDGLPAWCDCGNRLLSRSGLAADIAAGRRLLMVD